jgi:hypothetical protein
MVLGDIFPLYLAPSRTLRLVSGFLLGHPDPGETLVGIAPLLDLAGFLVEL